MFEMTTVGAYLPVGGMRERIVREFEMDVYTLLYFKWITNKDLLYSMWNSAQCNVAAMIEELVGRGAMDTCICMAESLPCSLETITTLLIGHTPIQKKKFLKISKEILQKRTKIVKDLRVVTSLRHHIW